MKMRERRKEEARKQRTKTTILAPTWYAPAWRGRTTGSKHTHVRVEVDDIIRFHGAGGMEHHGRVALVRHEDRWVDSVESGVPTDGFDCSFVKVIGQHVAKVLGEPRRGMSQTRRHKQTGEAHASEAKGSQERH